QIGDAYNAKWVRRLDGGHWSVVVRTYYVTDAGDGRVLLEQTEYLVCTDPGDPGSTELASSDGHATVAYEGPMDGAAVQAAAREAWAPTNPEWNNQMPDWRVPW
ncbi:hypothetical protein, partial [Dactylosporangium salmoneum]|uniref:hypothetical protein n=1 Tax=Dactylosporangium salmoneum TaxID=53361 RepID=UPI0031DB5767